MIVRTIGETHFLIWQSEHARQSAVLLAALHEDFLPDPAEQVSLIRATIEHDSGWDEWDNAPTLEGLLPPDFQRIGKPLHREIWRRTIMKTLRRYGPLEAALTARHAIELAGSNGLEETAHDQTILEALLERVWPGRASTEGRKELERLFIPLYLCDGLSLSGCVGWKNQLTIPLRHRDGSLISITAHSPKDWVVHVDPWPFAMPMLPRVTVDALAFPAERAADLAMILRSPDRWLVRIPIDYRPGVD